MRDEVMEFLRLGRLPSSGAEEAAIERHERVLARIPRPVTNEEAAALLQCFGEDDCYGLAWELLHLIETAPTPVKVDEPTEQANQWIRLIWQRARNVEGSAPPGRGSQGGSEPS